jgi:hypothetical protein
MAGVTGVEHDDVGLDPGRQFADAVLQARQHDLVAGNPAEGAAGGAGLVLELEDLVAGVQGQEHRVARARADIRGDARPEAPLAQAALVEKAAGQE